MADLSDFELINISGMPSGTAAGANFLAQDDGSNTTKITINQAVAASQAMQQVNNKIGDTALPTTAQTLTGAIAEHEADLTALNGKFSSLQMRSVTTDYNIAASTTYPGSTSWNLKTLIDSDMPAGYRCLGTSGYTTNNVQVVVIACRYNNSSYSLQIRNLSNSAQTGSVVVHYLCVSN